MTDSNYGGLRCILIQVYFLKANPRDSDMGDLVSDMRKSTAVPYSRRSGDSCEVGFEQGVVPSCHVPQLSSRAKQNLLRKTEAAR